MFSVVGVGKKHEIDLDLQAAVRSGHPFMTICYSHPSLAPLLLSVHLFVCLSVQATTLYTAFIFGTKVDLYSDISRSSLNMKAIGSRLCAKSKKLLISTCYSFLCGYRLLTKSKSRGGLHV